MINKQIIKIFTFLFLIVIVLSCKKDVNQPEIDNALIHTYIYEHDLDGTFTSSGLYYVINEPGLGSHPTINDKVNCSYKGYTLDGVVFDQNDYIEFGLDRVIVGWQEGIQLIGKGGKIKLIIPSGLAYGSSGSGSIGPNKVLVFDVTLNDIVK
ncbi:MAG: FKBP-type peptidyl-prolyl cis-trans isomerase [Bacteroidota bacterium]